MEIAKLGLCNFHLLNHSSMNNLLSYRGLVDARIRASDKDLSVKFVTVKNFTIHIHYQMIYCNALFF